MRAFGVTRLFAIAIIAITALSVIGSAQGPALGSAMHAAVAAGAFGDIRGAANAMGSVQRHVFTPIPENVEAYERLFLDYLELHDYFGRGVNDVMRRLRKFRRDALEGKN